MLRRLGVVGMAGGLVIYGVLGLGDWWVTGVLLLLFFAGLRGE